jgi:hypothetical protein
MNEIKKKLIAALKAFTYSGVPAALEKTVQECVAAIPDNTSDELEKLSMDVGKKTQPKTTKEKKKKMG